MSQSHPVSIWMTFVTFSLGLLINNVTALDWPLAASHLQSVIAHRMTHWRQSQIPPQLWQSTLPGQAIPSVTQTWKQLNPQLSRLQMNASEAEHFIATWFSPQVLTVYNTLPEGEMRSDFFRYAVLFIHGGFYADLDQMCKHPINEWLELQGSDRPAAALSSWSSCQIIIGLENEVHFCQWALASVRGHPVMAWVLQLVVERSSAFNATREHARHYYTGPGVFTDAVLSILQLTNVGVAKAYTMVHNDNKVMNRALDLGICFMGKDFFGGQNVAKFVEGQPQPEVKQEKPKTETETKSTVTESKSSETESKSAVTGTKKETAVQLEDKDALISWFGP